ncbi:endonuclease/exonuclease/phosphatase family protein [uncultured Stenotrophomonas sp.]|uniref:endonuclease/exonuclease/phosphatase family protein n=1 Tax=uncultured Stenotrophomonas sp. TaxID=165438 RepID=UPI0028EBD7CB|nr:endonuclease/exonuclease/phosphatase family protein [uncultured Stenotrophomonas sp.]
MLSRFRRPALLALIALALPLGSALARSPEPLRVMSFNVRTPVDTEPNKRWEDRRDAMVALLKEQHPVVFGTQELKTNQAEFLVQHLPGYRWFGEPRGPGDNEEHMGVFYDSAALKVVESGNFWLSDTPEVAGSITWGNLMPRMVTWALFQRQADGKQFYLYNTHLPYRDEDEPRRVLGAKLITERLAKLPKDIPIVVTGDFNSEPTSPTYADFTRTLGDARKLAEKVDGPRLTFQNFSNTPTSEIDWILVRGFGVKHFSTLDQTFDGVVPSDHYPVMAELVFPEATKR